MVGLLVRLSSPVGHVMSKLVNNEDHLEEVLLMLLDYSTWGYLYYSGWSVVMSCVMLCLVMSYSPLGKARNVAKSSTVGTSAPMDKL